MKTHPKILKTSIRIEFGRINNSPCMCLGLDLIGDRAPPPIWTGSTDVRDNLVSTVQPLRSGSMRRVTACGQLEFVCPWQLAPSKPRPARTATSTGCEILLNGQHLCQ